MTLIARNRGIAFLLLTFLLLGSSSHAQKKEKIIFYSKNKAKTYTIKTQRNILVTMEVLRNKEDTIYKSSYFFGTLIGKTDSTLQLTNVTYFNELNLSSDKKTQQFNEQVEYLDSLFEIPLQKINYIQKDNKVERIAPVIATFTALTGAFLAPIVAYNFKNNTFNSETYGAIAAPSAFISLGALAVGTTFQRRKLLVLPPSKE